MSSHIPLTAEQIEEQLDPLLDSILSSRRTAAEPARRLASLNRRQQDVAFNWLSIIASANAELAFQFAMQAPQAITAMDADGIQAWVMQTMDIYDKSGLHSAISQLTDINRFSEQRAAQKSGLCFDDISVVLENFIHGLNGRKLKVDVDAQIYTDTETIFLPPLINQFSTEQDNFKLYKAMAVHLWSQAWYGTWLYDINSSLSGFDNKAIATLIFHTLETIRLDACLARDLPGIHRDMAKLRLSLNEALVPKIIAGYHDKLQNPQATAKTSLNLIRNVIASYQTQSLCYQGVLEPHKVELIKTARLDQDKNALQKAFSNLHKEINGQTQQNDNTLEQNTDPKKFKVSVDRDSEQPFEFQMDLSLDGQLISIPDNIRNILTSIVQDLWQIPEEYLIAAGDGAYDSEQQLQQRDPDDVWKGIYHEEGAFLYNEWDYQRKNYRKNWAVLREKDVHPSWDSYVVNTLNSHYGLITQLRRTFEALRGEDKITKKQPYGEDIDIDAVVEAYADVKSGLELSDCLFIKKQKLERNIAVMFMVDMSGSTKGWINNAERESLIMLCESLETLGDRYAIYGFSGFTRKRCELYRIKRFEDNYDDDVRARISGIRPQDYTRMGVIIRHLSGLLNKVEAKTKLLITLSDGKPDDLDGYRGTYGIEDTRQALIEAKRDGIHPFCITIDTNASEYLPHMYGAVNYTVIDDVRKLPLKVSDIYRKLTS